MPELQNLSVNAARVMNDFGGLDVGNLSELANKQGKFTIDDAGKLTVMEPPQRRDNGFIRFFKGLFSASYRAEQRMLDRMGALEQNAHFSAAILQHAAQLHPFDPTVVSGEAHGRWGQALVGLLKDRAQLTPAMLKQALAIADTTSVAADLFSKLAERTDGSLKLVLTTDGPQSLDSFLRAHGEDAPPLDLALVALTNSILRGQNPAVSPNRGGQLLSPALLNEFRALSSKPAPLSAPDDERLSLLHRQIAVALCDALAELANTALQAGARSPEDVARALTGVVEGLANEQGPLEELAAACRQSLEPVPGTETRPAPKLPDTPANVAIRALAGGNEPRAARLGQWLEARHLTGLAGAMASLHAQARGLFHTFAGGFDVDGLCDVSIQLETFADEVAKLRASRPELGAKEFGDIFAGLAFAYAIEDGSRPIPTDLRAGQLAAIEAMWTDGSLDQTESAHPLNVLHAMLTGSREGAPLEVPMSAGNDGKEAIQLLGLRLAHGTQYNALLAGPEFAALLRENGVEALTVAQRNALDALCLTALNGTRQPHTPEAALSIIREHLQSVLHPEARARAGLDAMLLAAGTSPMDMKAFLRAMWTAQQGISVQFESLRQSLQERGKEVGPGEAITAAQQLMRPILAGMDTAGLRRLYGALVGDQGFKQFCALTTASGTMTFSEAGAGTTLLSEMERINYTSYLNASLRALADVLDERLGMEKAPYTIGLQEQDPDTPLQQAITFGQSEIYDETFMNGLTPEATGQVREVLRGLGMEDGVDPDTPATLAGAQGILREFLADLGLDVSRLFQ